MKTAIRIGTSLALSACAFAGTTITVQSNGHMTLWNKVKLLWYCLTGSN
jgi:hypothetical protein